MASVLKPRIKVLSTLKVILLVFHMLDKMLFWKLRHLKYISLRNLGAGIYSQCAHISSYLWLQSRNAHQSEPQLFVSLFNILLCPVFSSFLSFLLLPICIIRRYPPHRSSVHLPVSVWKRPEMPHAVSLPFFLFLSLISSVCFTTNQSQSNPSQL